MHGDSGSTQILTRHCGAKSQTINQLTNLGTMPTRQVPIVQHLRVIKTPAEGVSAHVAPPSDNLDGTMELH
jgi:ribosomal protein L10